MNLALHPQHQNQGFGSETMNLLKERAVRQRLAIHLSVFKTNQRVIAFHERLGFRILENTDTGCRMGWPGGSGL